ncbi:MAG TPA: hypothetical protein PL182_12810 [Pseudobdellovibrionaceae bacterium]|nr:hypothetical protein [Pseudobdellovibrionaceae bacterium]
MNGRTMARALILLLLILSVMEGGVQILLRTDGARFGFWRPGSYTLSEKKVSALQRKFDPILGWKNSEKDALEERENPHRFGAVEALTYGDSFVFGDEVGPSETWQAFLGEKLKKDVLNFGVNAYGMDQALLAYEKSASLPPARWVILGFTPSGINRIVNAYRKFLFVGTGVPLTKPRYVFSNGELSLLPNPVSSAPELVKLREVAFIEELCDSDLWCSETLRPRTVGFPVLGRLLNPEFWRSLRRVASANEFRPTGDVNLWKREEVLEVVAGIFGRFSKIAGERGSRMLFLLLPEREDTRAFLNGDFELDALWGICRREGLLCVDGVAEIGRAARDRGDLTSLHASGGHLSPEGNRRIAELLFRALSKESSRE